MKLPLHMPEGIKNPTPEMLESWKALDFKGTMREDKEIILDICNLAYGGDLQAMRAHLEQLAPRKNVGNNKRNTVLADIALIGEMLAEKQ